MKTRILRALISGLAMAQCLSALTGCDMSGASYDADHTEAKGVVRVVVGSENAAQTDSRTATPENPGFAYTLTFSAEGRPAVTAALYGHTGAVSLNAGTWTLIVTGEKNGETVAESDPMSVTVSEEGATVSVTVHPTLDGPNGTFRYAISADPALTEVSAVLTPRNVGNAAQNETALTIGGEREMSVAPGYYRLTVRAVKGAQPLVRRETVHIYSYTETYTSYALTEADFTPVSYLGGSVSGGVEGYSPVAVAAYEDAACGVFIDESAAAGGWSLAVEGTLETVYFKVRLAKDGASADAAYYSKPVTVSGLTASGKTDIVLPIEGYTITFDANGGAFEGGGVSLAMIAPENATLILPPAPQSERGFAGWYSADKRFTAETRVTGDAVLYAKWLTGTGDTAGYLANAEGGDSPSNPVMLVLNSDLANGGWEDLLSTIAAADKYVSLDLAACAMAGTEFDPGTGAGADKVTALTLPEAAQSIPTGTWENPTFMAFTTLASISGAGVVTVGGYAFYDCTSLESVSLPATTAIADWAFFGCTNLTEASLPLATYIYPMAFAGCTSLTSVSLSVVREIGYQAFSGCVSLTEASLPLATYIGYEAFSGCASLTEASLPVATSIYWGVFSGCASLTTVNLPVTTTSISYDMFFGCTSLESVSLPMATYIGHSAFVSCTSLMTVNLPVATDIGYSAFSGCTSLESVSLPVAADIGYQAFRGCTSLKSVSLPVAKNIDYATFFECASLESVSLPVATDIGFTAFRECVKLESVSLPVATTFGYEAFESCESLTTVNLPVATDIGDRAFYACTSLTTVNLPVATDIGARTFYACTSLTEVSLPVATNISYEVFYECTSLESVSLPVATSIDGAAFYGCASLESVSLPVAATIDGAAFRECVKLESVSLPVATSIGGAAFSGCESLTEVNLPKVTTIDDGGYVTSDSVGGAFENCTSLTSVSLPVATSIGGGAFYGCTSLTEVSLPAATSLGGGAFAVCTSLTSVNLSKVTILRDAIGNALFSQQAFGVFSFCTNLESVSLPVATDIGEGAFASCTSLTEVSLPAATSIGGGAFAACASLTSISLPKVTILRDALPMLVSGGGYLEFGVFMGCESLASVSLPAATTFGNLAFAYCEHLTTVSLPATPPSISAGSSNGIFYYTGSDGTITILVPSGAVSAYTSAWGVDANTPAGGNTSVYGGNNHKAVIITDTAQ
ncbi:MAG: leucine-rich repeat protein [Treponema sp.]|nr:leucine-rich repeat protein [Treponema sp.]